MAVYGELHFLAISFVLGNCICYKMFTVGHSLTHLNYTIHIITVVINSLSWPNFILENSSVYKQLKLTYKSESIKSLSWLLPRAGLRNKQDLIRFIPLNTTQSEFSTTQIHQKFRWIMLEPNLTATLSSAAFFVTEGSFPYMEHTPWPDPQGLAQALSAPGVTWEGRAMSLQVCPRPSPSAWLQLSKMVDPAVTRPPVTAGFPAPVAVPGTYKVCNKNVLIEWAEMNKPISAYLPCGMYWAVKYVFVPLFPWHTHPQSTMLIKHRIMELPSHLGKRKLTQSKNISYVGHLPHFTDDDTQPREKIQLHLVFFFSTHWTPAGHTFQHLAKLIWPNAGRAHGEGQSSTFTELTVQWT